MIHDLDATGLLCPLPVLKARKRLNALTAGDQLRMRADDPAAVMELRGGRQVKPNKRRLAVMANIFETQGAEELARFYAELSAERD